MATKIATPSFNSGADDKVAVADVYDKTESVDVITTAQMIADALPTSANDKLTTQGLRLTHDLSRTSQKIRATDTEKKAEAQTKREEDAHKALKNNGVQTAELSDEDAALLANMIGMAADYKLNERNPPLVDQNLNYIQAFDRASGQSARQLFRVTSRIIDDPQFDGIKESYPELATQVAVLDQAIRLGIPNIIDGVYNIIKTHREARRALINSLESACYNGDIHTINKILDLISPSSVLERVPDFVAILLSSYRFKRDVEPSDYPGLRNDLVQLLDKVSPGWDVDPSPRINGPLRPFIRMSEASTTLLQYEERFRHQVMIAFHYRTQDILDIMRNQYPDGYFVDDN